MIVILPFRKLELTDREWLAPILEALPYRMCDHSFSTLYIWQYKYSGRIAVEDDVIYLVYGYETDHPMYFAPICDDTKLADAVSRIEADAAERNVPFCMGAVNDLLKTKLEAVCPDRFDYTEDRDNADYIYDAESLRTYAGKKLHSKRNFTNRFEAEFEGRYTVEPVSKDNLKEIMAFNHGRCLATREEKGISLTVENCGMHEEACAISTALIYREPLHIKGVCLKLDGKVVAYALGTKLNADTWLEQIEKADPSVPGAYPMITRAFARMCTEDARYINREEDMGIEGLRKAKLSFNPECINLRYTVTAKEE